MSYVIFNKTLAIQLRRKGYKILGSAPNNINPLLDVYYFRDDPGLREEVEAFQTNSKQRKNQKEKQEYDKRKISQPEKSENWE